MDGGGQPELEDTDSDPGEFALLLLAPSVWLMPNWRTATIM